MNRAAILKSKVQRKQAFMNLTVIGKLILK